MIGEVPMDHPYDALVFGPDDVDLSRSPLAGRIDAETYVLGAFNPGMTRLANGNLLLMVRVAEALGEAVDGAHVRAIRWTPGGYVLDRHPLIAMDMKDPRQFERKDSRHRMLGLTSLSWLLPVELTPDGSAVVAVHYDRAIEPAASYEDYGVEDARISKVDGRWYMTVCAVSAERHCTALLTSDDCVNWRREGVVLDHQNKDMILFEGKPGGMFAALTRPLGEVYFLYPEDSPFVGGPSINLARSPDALHWRPMDAPGIRARKGSTSAEKVGGGTPPVLTEEGWLTIYHGVETRRTVGVYRSFWALLDRDDPTRILRLEDDVALIEANAALTAPIADRLYLPSPVVFSTGIIDAGDHWLVASGEADLACRMTRLKKGLFS